MTDVVPGLHFAGVALLRQSSLAAGCPAFSVGAAFVEAPLAAVVGEIDRPSEVDSGWSPLEAVVVVHPWEVGLAWRSLAGVEDLSLY